LIFAIKINFSLLNPDFRYKNDFFAIKPSVAV
jgi:hypothetical protein